jgi:hypothetical protein
MKKIFFSFLLLGIFSSTNGQKTVDIIAQGSGNNSDDIIKKALRNAIEQAFGTFVTSNTQVINDALVKDEIATVSSGNIKSYKIISESDTKVTIKAVVSLESLGSFCRNKGISADFDGAMFGFAIKQQQLNEKGEEIAFKNLSIILDEILKQSFDYEVIVKDPKVNGNNYHLPIAVIVKTNSNIEKAHAQMLKTMEALNMSENEIKDYLKFGKSPFDVTILPVKKGIKSFYVSQKNIESINDEFISETSVIGLGRKFVFRTKPDTNIYDYRKYFHRFRLIFGGTNISVTGNLLLPISSAAFFSFFNIDNSSKKVWLEDYYYGRTIPTKSDLIVAAYSTILDPYPLPKTIDFISSIKKIFVQPNF